MRARRPSAKRRWYPGLLALAAFLSALPAAAQAWTPPAGAGAVGIVYQTIDNTGHRLTDGSFLPGYESESRAIHLQVDYAVSDRLSFSIGVPYIFSKYSGAEPSFSGLPVDECRCWNHGWQDVGASVRYNLINGRLFAVTPSISIGVPTNDYNYFGEAVAGRNLTEMRIGVAAGQRLDIISPRFSLQESYSYAVVEKVLGLPNNRSNFSLEPAFQITRKLAAGAILSWQHTHGGLSGTEFDTTEKFAQFDRLLRDNNFHTGGNISYSLSRFDVFISYIHYLRGTDTHAGHAVTAGVSLPFESRAR